MLFTLPDQVHFTESSGIRHFLGLYVLRREDKFFGIHQQDTMLTRRCNHPFAFFHGHGQRLFANDVP